MRISDWSSDVCSSDLAVQPSDSMIDEVLVQHQGRIPALQIHWLGAVIERGPELICFRTDEAIKFFEAETRWPLRKRTEARRVRNGCVRTGRTQRSQAPQQKEPNTTTTQTNTHK